MYLVSGRTAPTTYTTLTSPSEGMTVAGTPNRYTDIRVCIRLLRYGHVTGCFAGGADYVNQFEGSTTQTTCPQCTTVPVCFVPSTTDGSGLSKSVIAIEQTLCVWQRLSLVLVWMKRPWLPQLWRHSALTTLEASSNQSELTTTQSTRQASLLDQDNAMSRSPSHHLRRHCSDVLR